MQKFRLLFGLVAVLALSACASGPINETAPDDGKTVTRLASSVLSGKWDESGIADEISATDRIYAQRTTQDALEYNKTFQVATWRNPESGNSGTVIPKRTFKSANGQNCRYFETAVFADGQRYTGAGTACRRPDGRWVSVGDA